MVCETIVSATYYHIKS